MPSDEHLFACSPEIEHFIDVASTDRYVSLPDSWCVAIADVVNSTKAIAAGRYRDVNAVGVATIVAARNAASPTALPFSFGGDGATVLFPSSVRSNIESALRGVRRLCHEVFNMELRAGVVRVADLRQAGHEVRVARHRLSPYVTLPALAGSGISAAEQWIKERHHAVVSILDDAGPVDADLSGFECRWQPVQSERGSMLALIVQAIQGTADQQTPVYRSIIRKLDSLVGNGICCPLRESSLKLLAPAASFTQEAGIRSGRKRGARRITAEIEVRAMTSMGNLLLTTGLSARGFDGKLYRQQLVANSDYRKFG